MINILYKGRVIYHHLDDNEVTKVLLELAENETVDVNEIEIEEIKP